MTRDEIDNLELGDKIARKGDIIEIKGNYQYRALTQGNPIQKFWHYSKILAIEKLLPPSAGEKILDVGCGSGVISEFLGTFGAEVVGIDSNPDAVRFAANTFSNERVSFRVGLADKPLGTEASVDKIYCLELIEHIYIYQFSAMLTNFQRVLRPGGKVFLTTPNYHSMWPAIEWFMDIFSLAPHMAKHQHVELYHRKKLRNFCTASGFCVEHLGTMCFLAPWLALLSWSFAKAVAELELGLSLIPGSLLVCVLSKQD